MNVSKNNTLAFVLLLAFSFIFSFLPAQQVTDNQLKAGLIYNFLKNLNWENETQIDTFKIGVYGEDKAFIDVLHSIEKLKAKNKPIKLILFDSYINIPFTHVLLITSDKNFLIRDVVESISERNTLLVTDLCNYQRYVMINFIYNAESKVQFEINSKNLELARLKTSPKLILLGGSEIDVRKLYVETEKSLVSTKEMAQQYERELYAKKKELQTMDSDYKKMKTDFDLLQNKILMQKGELNELSAQTRRQDAELVQKSNVLTKQQIEIIHRERQLSSKDREIQIKQTKIDEFSNVLNKQQSEIDKRQAIIKSQEKNLFTQSEKIKSQLRVLYLLVALIITAFLLVYAIYRNYKANRRKNFELQRVNSELNASKNEILEQSRLLELKNIELEKLSIVASKTDNAVVIMNAKGEFEWVNEGFSRMYGYTLEQYINLKGISLKQVSAYEHIAEILNRVLIDKISATYESASYDKNNHRIWTHSTLTPILDNENQVQKLIVIDSNITSLKEAELSILEKNEEIQRQSEELYETTEQLMGLNQELEIKHSKLEEALDKLKGTQSQLVESEKMVVLGQLTAGIAHEINNPISYINSGVEGLTIAFDQIISLLTEYENLVHHTADLETQNLEKIKKQIGYPELLTDVRQLVTDIKSGVFRTVEIVKGLRTFSRLDESDLKQIDLHQSIDSTLVLLRNKYINKIEVVRNYGNIPKLECFPGKINQVLLNIIVNAIQAIKDKGEIEIITRHISKAGTDFITIAIKDSGLGMSPEVKKKIFEPFFTTKEIGEGTGLGLSISFNIIESHYGTIEVESEPGRGTTFTIFIPVVHEKKPKQTPIMK